MTLSQTNLAEGHLIYLLHLDLETAKLLPSLQRTFTAELLRVPSTPKKIRSKHVKLRIFYAIAVDGQVFLNSAETAILPSSDEATIILSMGLFQNSTSMFAIGSSIVLRIV